MLHRAEGTAYVSFLLPWRLAQKGNTHANGVYPWEVY